MSVKSVIVVWM